MIIYPAVDLREGRCVRLVRGQAGSETVFADDLPKVYYDRTRIRQVVLNLVSNAARYTEKGGITLGAKQEDHHVIVSIADTGPGIAPEDIERIFEPFYQGMGSRPDLGGSGLGLSVSQQLIELHEGQIWLESELNKGSTFFIAVPIANTDILSETSNHHSKKGLLKQ